MGRPAFWDVVQKYLGTCLGIAILLAGGGITAYAIAGAWVAIIPLVANSFAMRADLAAAGGVDLTVWRRITIGGAPFFALAGLNLLQGAIDIPMLEGLAGTVPVGWYSLAIRWVSMPSLLAVVAATAFFPALSAEGASVNRAFTNMANRCLQLVALIAIPASVGIALIADRFITLLYGDEFQQSVPLMRLLSLEIPIAAINVVIGVVIIAADRQRQWVVVALLAAIFNPLANLVAIPWATDRFDNGAIGAAATTVLTELIMLAGAMKLKPAGVFDHELRRIVGRIVLASSAMVPVVLVLDDVPLFVTVAAAGAVYAVGAVALRAISGEELRQLRSQLARRRQGTPVESTEESGSPL
jgi:O-antigen/teichoic acid export membrane protein